ncbi:hypothetical protein [Actinoallomurus sp. NPDC052274]|uniref:hypothetical protein n=1 Tax=Actinoallomurus sp. NPDC052274 TaxID=3155420 RepID=UPI0034236666
MCIEIDSSGQSFVWRRDDHDHHRMDDPTGAAIRIAEYLKERIAPDRHRGV